MVPLEYLGPGSAVMGEPVPVLADLVIGADIVFDTSVIPHLVNVISRCLSDLGTEKVIMANCVRNETTDAYFMKYLEQSNILFTKETHTLDCGTPLNLYIIRNK